MIVNLKDRAVADGRKVSHKPVYVGNPQRSLNDTSIDLEDLIAGLKAFDTPEDRGAFAYGFFGRYGVVADLVEAIEKMQADSDDESYNLTRGFDDLTEDLNEKLNDLVAEAEQTISTCLEECGFDNYPFVGLSGWIQRNTKRVVEDLADALRTEFHSLAKQHGLEA